MASFRQHGNGWQARVRRKGTPDQTKSFLSVQDAQKWARAVEIEIDRGTYVDTSNAQRTTMADLIDRCIVEALPSMKGEKEDRIRLNAIKRCLPSAVRGPFHLAVNRPLLLCSGMD